LEANGRNQIISGLSPVSMPSAGNPVKTHGTHLFIGKNLVNLNIFLALQHQNTLLVITAPIHPDSDARHNTVLCLNTTHIPGLVKPNC
jgi:hypothetical protein